MTDKKLTTEAIVQSLDGADVFLRDLAGSTHTSLNEYDIGILFNIAYLCGDAADLINRQKAEKEALIAGQETLQKYIAEQKAEIERLNKQLVFEIESAYDRGTKAAVKGFAERLKSVVAIHNGDMWSKYEYIDNLVKEMVGDDNEKV